MLLLRTKLLNSFPLSAWGGMPFRSRKKYSWLEQFIGVMAVMKIDLSNAFNLVSRQAVLNAVNLHFPELLSWSTWCYGQYPILWHTLGSITSESGVQQGEPLGLLLFCLVFNLVVCVIATDSECATLPIHRWQIDDGVVAGPISAVLHMLSIIKDLGPLSVFISIRPNVNYSVRVNGLSRFPDEMKKSNVPHFNTWGAQIGYFLICAKYIAQKHTRCLLVSPAVSPGRFFRSSCSHASTPSIWRIL